MSNTTTFTLRVDSKLLERIDADAQHAGVTRTAYVLSWLPAVYDEPQHSDTETSTNSPQPAHR